MVKRYSQIRAELKAIQAVSCVKNTGGICELARSENIEISGGTLEAQAKSALDGLTVRWMERYEANRKNDCVE